MISDTEALEAYAAVEAAYTQRLWPDVLAQGQALREALATDDDVFRPRLLLLEGHALLHGYADAQAAADHYRRVLSSADSSLCQLAEEALASLSATQSELEPDPQPQPLMEEARPEVGGSEVGGGEAGGSDPFPFTAAAVGVAPAAMATAAMPWLNPAEPAVVLDKAPAAAPAPAPEPVEVEVVHDPLPVPAASGELPEQALAVEPVQAAELAAGLLRVRLD